MAVMKYCWLFITPAVCMVRPTLPAPPLICCVMASVCFCLNGPRSRINIIFTMTHWSQLFARTHCPSNLPMSSCSQGTLIFSIVRYSPLKFNSTYVYPVWANVIGWFLATISLSLIPLWIIYKLYLGKGSLKDVSSASRKWIDLIWSHTALEKKLDYWKIISFSDCTIRRRYMFE